MQDYGRKVEEMVEANMQASLEEELLTQAVLLWGPPADHYGLTIWEAIELRWPRKENVTREEWNKVQSIKHHVASVIAKLKEMCGKEVPNAKTEGRQEDGTGNLAGESGGQEEG